MSSGGGAPAAASAARRRRTGVTARRGGRAHRHHALLVALADAAHDPALHVDVALAQADQLAHAQAAAVQELEGREVALPQRPGGHDGGEDRLDLLDGEHARQLLRALGRAQRAPRGRPRARSRARGTRRRSARRPCAARRSRPRRPRRSRRTRRGRRRSRPRRGSPPRREEGRERGQIAPVGGHGVRAEAALVADVVEELADQRIGRRPLVRSLAPREPRRAAPRPLRGRPGGAHQARRHGVQLVQVRDAQGLARRMGVLEPGAERQRREAELVEHVGVGPPPPSTRRGSSPASRAASAPMRSRSPSGACR